MGLGTTQWPNSLYLRLESLGLLGESSALRYVKYMQLGSARLIIVSGKGGTGKSTVAAALATAYAAKGERALYVCAERPMAAAALFGREKLTITPLLVRDGLQAMHIDSMISLEQYAAKKLYSKTIASKIFSLALVKNFFEAIPSMLQWAILGKCWDMASSGDYDRVILDAPATGHLLSMLAVPRMLTDLIPTGPLRTDAAACLKMLKDPLRGGVVLTSLPEDLPVTEALELASKLRSTEVSVLGGVLNALPQLEMSEPLLQLFKESPPEDLSEALETYGLEMSEKAAFYLQNAVKKQELMLVEASRFTKGLGAPSCLLPELNVDSADQAISAQRVMLMAKWLELS